MDEKVRLNHLNPSMDNHHHQRYFKLTRKGRVPKVTRVWPAEEKPWYIRYAFDWMLLLISTLLLYMRIVLSINEWLDFILEVLIASTLFMWLTRLTPKGQSRQ
ncbi:MAG: hypothetical protein ACXADF_16525 [Candidatus Thorarchaeota archaeon]